jgi:hypothetical protein
MKRILQDVKNLELKNWWLLARDIRVYRVYVGRKSKGGLEPIRDFASDLMIVLEIYLKKMSVGMKDCRKW